MKGPVEAEVENGGERADEVPAFVETADAFPPPRECERLPVGREDELDAKGAPPPVMYPGGYIPEGWFSGARGDSEESSEKWFLDLAAARLEAERMGISGDDAIWEYVNTVYLGKGTHHSRRRMSYPPVPSAPSLRHRFPRVLLTSQQSMAEASVKKALMDAFSSIIDERMPDILASIERSGHVTRESLRDVLFNEARGSASTSSRPPRARQSMLLSPAVQANLSRVATPFWKKRLSRTRPRTAPSKRHSRMGISSAGSSLSLLRSYAA